MTKTQAHPRWAERTLLHKGGTAATWGNLGLWDEATPDYAAACAALARRVAQAAGMAAGDRVLSVGCGAGDELAMWRDGFDAAEVVGVENDPELRAAAQALAGATVLRGSGTALDALGLPSGHFDRIVCVDAAYHLRPRSAFLKSAATLLRPGGRLAFTDLTLQRGSTAFNKIMFTPGTLMSGVALNRLPTPAEQLHALQEAGFGDVQVLALDDAVLGGFADFVWEQGWTLGVMQLSRAWKRSAYTAALIKPCRWLGMGYALFSARREPLAPSPRDTAPA